MLEFAWDPVKDVKNRKKHGISFDTALRVFEDPAAVSYVERVIDGEQRWHTIGSVGGIAVLLVAHTVEVSNEESIESETIRIISARKASRGERHLYEAAY